MREDLLQNQKSKRDEYLQLILDSNSPKKLIVSGPGTGKTYTFEQLFLKARSSNNLALTFIRKLVYDMEIKLGCFAEVKTFHAFCKKILHEKRGGFELFPFLTKIIEEDSILFGYFFSDFSDHFQLLKENSQQVAFYISRGNYYNAVCFDDSVYRVLKISETDPDFLPRHEIIVVDEYQDFNPLEVAFIDQLQKCNHILIVGDDDQAVYSLRNSSPKYIRDKYHSGDYEIFELPFCSRCPKVVVDATNIFINSVIAHGGFQSRINRKFVAYVEGNEFVNTRYPKIATARISTITCYGKFIKTAIEKIPYDEIKEANEEGYPCVLVVGKRQYLNPIYKELSKHFSRVNFSSTVESSYSLLDAYKIIKRKPESNIGWRMIASLILEQEKLKSIILNTKDLTPIINLLPANLVEQHKSIIKLLSADTLSIDELNNLTTNIDVDFEPIIEYFYPEEVEDEPEPDYSEPTIMLTSFEGCKGLSACHVFIVGLNKGVLPQLNEEKKISDIEVSKFIVAMTRTRKMLYLLSNKFDYNPRSGQNFVSPFIKLIPEEMAISSTYINAESIPGFVNRIFQ